MMINPSFSNPVAVKAAPLSPKAKAILTTLKGAEAHFIVREILWQLGVNSDLIADVHYRRKPSPAVIAEMKDHVIPKGRKIVVDLGDPADALNLAHHAMRQLGYESHHFILIGATK